MWKAVCVLALCSQLLYGSVFRFASPDLAAKQAARRIADLIVSKKGDKTVLGLATGSTMIPVYRELKKIVCEEKIDLSNVVTFNLDEYLGIPSSHPQSYRSFMYAHLFEGILGSGIKEENIHIPSSESWMDYERLIESEGPIDLQLLGIGRNGHIGFAEPGADGESKTMIVDLADATRQDNARFFDGQVERVPRQAVTMGVGTIVKAKEIVLLAFGKHKADAVAQALTAPIRSEVPATFLQAHPRVDFFLDSEAAQQLDKKAVRRFANARLLIDHRIQEGDLWVANGKIVAPQDQADEEIDVRGRILAPGFIDLQINGGFGCDFSRNPERISEVARQLPQFGVTSFFATVVSSSRERYRAVLPRLQPCEFCGEGAANLGIHLEGPFFAPAYAGAHDPQYILPEGEALEGVYGDLQGVKLVTLAPELPKADQLIRELKSQGIRVLAGHSAATLEQMKTGIETGVGCCTHLFNAMKPFHHREPGIPGAALLQPQLPYTLILDGAHLASETLMLCWKCNPEGMILVTDATEILGLPDGKYQLGSMNIEAYNDRVYVANTHTIAGSRLSLDKAVRTLHRLTGCSLAAALEAASLKPAQFAGLYPAKGVLAIGSDADFILLSDALDVEATYIGGTLVWSQFREASGR